MEWLGAALVVLGIIIGWITRGWKERHFPQKGLLKDRVAGFAP